jgi:uncharacterized protein (DUF1499 family)
MALGLLGGCLVGHGVSLLDSPGPWTRLGTYLTTNVAETVDGSPFPELRPRRYAVGPQALLTRAAAAAAGLPRWRVVAVVPERRELRAVVTSAIFRFEDDVVARVVAEPMRSTLLIRAASRVGKGDLGANTGHVLALYEALERLGLRGEIEDAPAG